MLTLTLLGGFDIRIDGSELQGMSRRERALLAWIAMHPHQSVGREATACLLWGDRPQKNASASLSQALYSLRKFLEKHGCSAVEANNETICLKAGEVEVDALQFRDLIKIQNFSNLAAAETLYRGEFLRGFVAPTEEFEKWMDTERNHLRAAAVEALIELLNERETHSENAEIRTTATKLLEIDPYCEPAARALMQYHAKQGQLGLAVAIFDEISSRLRNDLGAQPDAETLALNERVLRHEYPPDSDRATTEPLSSCKKRPRGRFSAAPWQSAVAIFLVLAVAVFSWYFWKDSDIRQVDPDTMEHALPAKPSIAVLAFSDQSQGPENGYLSDAVSEGIIGELSRFPELFVIARNSSFYYRDKAADVRDISQELGVRYILDGSQQKAGDQLRVSVQLVDAVAGNYVWSETYDRELSDIFEVQDEIVSNVASTVGARVLKDAGTEARDSDPARLSALLHHLEARNYFRQFTREGTEKARLANLAAIEADPKEEHGYVGMAFVYINGYRWGWTNLDRQEALAKARQYAQKAISLAPDSYDAHHAMGYVHVQAGELDHAIAQAEIALKLNPNATNVMATLAEPLAYAGRAEEATELMERAMRLDPHHPEWFNWNLGWTRWLTGECDAALDAMHGISSMPPLAYRVLAIIYVCLDRPDEARDAIQKLRELNPGYTIADVRKNFRGKYKNISDYDRYLDSLRMAGLPENDTAQSK